MLWTTRIPQQAWNPWLELEQFRGQMNRWMADESVALSSPPIQLWMNDDGLRLTALVPGVATEDLDLSVEGDELTLKWTVRDEATIDKARITRRERRSGTVTRTLQLPYSVDAEGVRASLASGRLEVDLPRAESDKPRRVEIQSN
ncbi:MAG: Hsp20/alpha crystallin family protein [Planctomycetes bacterium]|nr:Hsp20/alpha crystallin family protein [Planctomycetota bacterium]